MQLKGKALFNLLRIHAQEDPTVQVHPWQVEDLRDLDIEELFSRLKKLGLSLDEPAFYLYAEDCDSPEQVVDCLWDEEEDVEGRGKAYLLLFELWRRLLPGKLCLSVFCDEFDQLIELYDGGELEGEEPLQSALSILEDILDDATDEEGDGKKVFSEVASHCAHDLEQFIADYISDQIVDKNGTYASELLEAFYPYISSEGQFDLLRARLVALSDSEKASVMFQRILEELREDPDLNLLMQVTESLVHKGDVRLFTLAVKQTIPLLSREEEFQNLLTMTADYFRCLDLEDKEKAVTKLLEKRSDRQPEHMLDPADEALSHFSQLVTESVPG